MGWSFTIGRIAGTAIKVHGTFLILLAIYGWIGFNEGGPAAGIESVTVLLALFACVLAHEFGHIAAARRYGVRTPDVLLLPIGGVARLERMPDEPRQEFVIAIAGPLVTLAIAALAWGALRAQGWDPDLTAAGNPGIRLLGSLYTVNVALLLFNLVPAFPMDGGRVLRSLLAAKLGLARATRIAASVGQALAIMLGIYALANGRVILALVALFVFFGAGSEAQATLQRESVRGLTVEGVMVRDVATLPAWGRLQQAIDLLVQTEQREFPVVDPDGRVVGLLSRDTLIRGIHRGGMDAEIAGAMHAPVTAIGADMPMEQALQLMQAARLSALPVLDAAQRPIGLVTADNLLDVLLTRQAAAR
jgi:stage IV sporulation protein FB